MSTSKSYHHGDLRAALLEAGLRALEHGGEAEISLRALAREIGVSPAAVYRHFPDKKALLGALGGEGFRLLGEAQSAAQRAAPGRSAGFAATGRAYVRFALAHPALFRLAFFHGGIGDDQAFGENLASQLLNENALALAGGDPERAKTIALQAWASAHGLALLILDGLLPNDDALIDAVLDARTLFVRQGSSNDESP